MRFLDSLRRMGLLPALLLAFATPVRATGASAGIRPYVLDCGRIAARDMGRFDHSGALDGKPGTMSVPCFLVRHPNRRASCCGKPAWATPSPTARTASTLPAVKVDRAATLASMDRFEAIAAQTHARVVIRHDPHDIALLPRFPAYLP